ncbi:MAG: hypothetical protein J0I48_10605 [Devosia sp.]|uniref:hypothetical protein n=1 Tax=Devosia sp. 66-22 TaxID=1895753 RepID=UPI00092B4BCA|nr:hypothetical protein [Devosia sp. 66-22]MBN9346631.1 hypothetical protein [Devosia sp.]OJX54712.1 MAG: hypothetical protein BGO81_16460 [Devosia sp. 66-22]
MPLSNSKRPVKTTDERVLHPTKGYRKVSVKRGRAATAMQAILRGGMAVDLRSLQQFIRG